MPPTRSGTRTQNEDPDLLFAAYRDTGDAAALGALFDATSRDLLRIALSLLPDAAAAEDAVQETYLAAIEFAERWDGTRPVVPWLVGVLRHKVEARRRDGARRVDESRLFTRLPPLDPAGVAELREEGERLRAAMDALPEPYRQAALLRWRHGLDPAEIAHLTGATPGAIRVRLHRALARLRERVRGGAALALLPPPSELTGETPRGLDVVRHAMMSRARVVRHVGATAAAGGIVGGLLMTGKGAVAAACVLLAVVGAAWWAVSGGGDETVASAGTATASVAAGSDRDRDRAASPGVGSPAPDAPPAAATPHVPDGPAISGRVVDATGRGVAGARVVVVAAGTKDLVRADVLDAPTDVAASALTAADGAFAVAARGGGRVFDVLVSAEGYAPSTGGRVRPGAPVEIRLDPEAVLRGRVVGSDGTAIPGAELRLTRLAAGGVVDERAVLTAADGTFRLGGLASRAAPAWAAAQPVTQILTVRAQGFAPLRAEVAARDDAAPRDVVLFRGVPLTVTVVDGETGAPIEGATVAFGDRSGGVSVPVWRSHVRMAAHPSPDMGVATTGEGGRAVFPEFPGERASFSVFVRAWKRGFTAEATNTSESGPVGAVDVKLSLWPSATVRGRVVEASGAPVAGARVTVLPGAPDWFPAPFGDRPWPGGVTTGADGTYVLPGVRSGRVAPVDLTLTAGPPWGEAVLDAAFTSRDRAQAKVASRAGADVAAPDLVIGTPKPTPRAVVTVTDAAGAPVEDAAVESMGATVPVVRTDADGRAVVRWHVDPALLGPGVRGAGRVVRVSAPGFATASADVEPSADRPPEIAVQLAPGRTLVVVVRTTGGEPARGAAVWATRGERERAYSVEGVEKTSGMFTFADVGQEPMDVHARAASAWRDLPETVVPGVVAGGAPVEIVLAADTVETGAVEGTVRDAATGAPVASFEIEVVAPHTPRASGDALTAGTFRIRGVPVGTWVAHVRPRGRLAEDVVVTVTRDAIARVDVRVSRGVPIAGRVRVPEGVVQDTPRVDLRRIDLGPADPSPPGSQGWAWIKDGSFRMAAVRPGRYVAVIALNRGGPRTPPDVRVGAAPVVVPAGRTDPLEVDLALVATGTVHVKVDDAGVPPVPPDADETGAEPPRDCAVEFLEATSADPARGRVALERGFWRGGTVGASVAPGEYVVLLHVPGQQPRRARVTIRAGETAEVVFAAE